MGNNFPGFGFPGMPVPVPAMMGLQPVPVPVPVPVPGPQGGPMPGPNGPVPGIVPGPNGPMPGLVPGPNGPMPGPGLPPGADPGRFAAMVASAAKAGGGVPALPPDVQYHAQEAHAQDALGWHAAQSGDLNWACTHWKNAAMLDDSTGNFQHEASMWNAAAQAAGKLGCNDEARQDFMHAAAVDQRIGNAADAASNVGAAQAVPTT